MTATEREALVKELRQTAIDRASALNASNPFGIDDVLPGELVEWKAADMIEALSPAVTVTEEIREHLSDQTELNWTVGTREKYLERSHYLLEKAMALAAGREE